MKIFWSWQSDTPGNIGRHFVRDALKAAVKTLKEVEDLDEPLEREVREALHLDSDRQGVSGSPDLVATILGKIDDAGVFVADVTLVGRQGDENGDTKKMLINSNVAIEYGYALRSIGDKFILMVQNSHYGDRDELPFDLRHKAGPIQYTLSPDATAEQIKAERAKLKGALVAALKPCFVEARKSRTTARDQEVDAVRNYFAPELARVVAKQISIQERAISNFITTSTDQSSKGNGDTWAAMKPSEPQLYPNAPEFARLSPADATLLIEFYNSVREISDFLSDWIANEPPPPRVNAWNVLMQKTKHSLELGLNAVRTFCPDRQYDATIPIAGTLATRIEKSVAGVQPALKAHLDRFEAAANTLPATRRRQVRLQKLGGRNVLPHGPQSWMAR